MSYLDTRDLQRRLDELRTQHEAWQAGEEDPLEPDELEELSELEELASEVGEWQYGETLISVDEMEDYARQLAEDLNVFHDSLVWPFTCIDWERAAEELAQDYTEVTYLGSTYYVRSC